MKLLKLTSQEVLTKVGAKSTDLDLQGAAGSATRLPTQCLAC